MRAIVEADDWEEPGTSDFREAAVVSAAFPEMFRHRNNLTFTHRKEVAALFWFRGTHDLLNG